MRRNATAMSTSEGLQMHPWGTWEELLLACAVNRHGSQNWESVVSELRSRMSSSLILTVQNCKQKYCDLQRRFASKPARDADEASRVPLKTVPWLDELRKLRVEELRREVQQYDASIVKLQLKLKSLKEERQRSLKGRVSDSQDLDPSTSKSDEDGCGERQKSGENEKPSGRRETGDDSDRDNRSFNESNSTDQDKRPESRFEDVEQFKQENVTGTGDLARTDISEKKRGGERSYDSSSDTGAKGLRRPPLAKSPAAAPLRQTHESVELHESVAESNGAKENSDVQSTASLSKKAGNRRRLSGHSSGEEPETDGVSPVTNRLCVKSQSLMRFLDIIRSHKDGSLFERRLESQGSETYRGMIRQHVDLQTIKSKLEAGLYSVNRLEFFRDLLLLCNNAIVFFPKSSTESAAALQIRKIISKELRTAGKSMNRLYKESLSVQNLVPGLQHSTSPVAEKPKSSASLTICRKRSSFVARTTGDSKFVGKVKVEDNEEDLDMEPSDKDSEDLSAEPRSTKNCSKERHGTTGKGSTGGKGRSSGSNYAGQLSYSNSDPHSVYNTDANISVASDRTIKRNLNTFSVSRKRSSANFLNRAKHNSFSSNGKLWSTLTTISSPRNNKELGTEAKRSTNGDRQKDQPVRAGYAGQEAADCSTPVTKRGVGRPPKRAIMQSRGPLPPARSTPTKETPYLESRAPSRKRGRRW